MPLYEYNCLKCKKNFEKIQKFSDPLIETCMECGGKVQKLLFPPAIQFKGSGWYVTDYARKVKPESTKEKKDLSPIKGSSNESCPQGSPTISTNTNSLNDSPAEN